MDRLREPYHPRPVTPQCSWPVEDKGRSRNGRYGRDVHLCHRWSMIEVDGAPYCTQHAALVSHGS